MGRGLYQRGGKRVLDVALAGAALMVTAPVQALGETRRPALPT